MAKCNERAGQGCFATCNIVGELSAQTRLSVTLQQYLQPLVSCPALCFLAQTFSDRSNPCDGKLLSVNLLGVFALFRPRGERGGKALSGASESERSSQSHTILQIKSSQ